MKEQLGEGLKGIPALVQNNEDESDLKEGDPTNFILISGCPTEEGVPADSKLSENLVKHMKKMRVGSFGTITFPDAFIKRKKFRCIAITDCQDDVELQT